MIVIWLELNSGFIWSYRWTLTEEKVQSSYVTVVSGYTATALSIIFPTEHVCYNSSLVMQRSFYLPESCGLSGIHVPEEYK